MRVIMPFTICNVLRHCRAVGTPSDGGASLEDRLKRTMHHPGSDRTGHQQHLLKWRRRNNIEERFNQQAERKNTEVNGMMVERYATYDPIANDQSANGSGNNDEAAQGFDRSGTVWRKGGTANKDATTNELAGFAMAM